MSFFNSKEQQQTALIVGGTAVGAMALYYLWDRYSADTAAWAHEKKEDAKVFAKNAEHKLEEKAQLAKDKLNGSSSSTGKNVTPAPAPVLAKEVKVTETTVVTPVVAASTVVLEKKTNDRIIVAEPELKKIKEREAVVQEVVHPVEVEEVQPVIHREIKKVEVHQITQPIYEEVTAPLRELNRDLVAEHRPVLYEDTTEYQKEFESGLEVGSRTYDKTKKKTVYMEPIIEEVIKTDIIEVIQPVIHRDTIEPVVIHTNQPIYEKVKEQPTIVHETRKPIILTHDDVERLQSVKGNDQLALLEQFSEKQSLGPIVDRTFDETLIVEEKTTTVIETTEIRAL